MRKYSKRIYLDENNNRTLLYVSSSMMDRYDPRPKVYLSHVSTSTTNTMNPSISISRRLGERGFFSSVATRYRKKWAGVDRNFLSEPPFNFQQNKIRRQSVRIVHVSAVVAGKPRSKSCGDFAPHLSTIISSVVAHQQLAATSITGTVHGWTGAPTRGFSSVFHAASIVCTRRKPIPLQRGPGCFNAPTPSSSFISLCTSRAKI